MHGIATSRWVLVLLATWLAGQAPARADRSPAGPEPAPYDVSRFRDRLTLIGDGDDHYLALIDNGQDDRVFYGDGKDMYAITIFGMTSDSTQTPPVTDYLFWAARTGTRGALAKSGNVWTLRCGERKTSLTVVDGKKASTILATASFRQKRWRRRALLLARDDRGVFYYVDRLDATLGKGYRMWVGKKGKLSLQKLTDVVDDSVGFVFFTKAGDLWFDFHKDLAHWAKGKRDMPLKVLPIDRNLPLIYEQLGVYRGELFGTPCDDL